MEEFHVLVNLWMWSPNLESTAALCLSIFSSFKILSAWKFNNVEKCLHAENSTSKSGPPRTCASRGHPSCCDILSFNIFSSCACSQQQRIWELWGRFAVVSGWVFSSGSVRAGLVIDGSFSVSLSLSFILSVCICTFWIFAYMHAFTILRMPCVNLAWIFWECLVVRFVLWIFQMLLEFPCDCNVRIEFSNFLEF